MTPDPSTRVLRRGVPRCRVAAFGLLALLGVFLTGCGDPDDGGGGGGYVTPVSAGQLPR